MAAAEPHVRGRPGKIDKVNRRKGYVRLGYLSLAQSDAIIAYWEFLRDELPYGIDDFTISWKLGDIKDAFNPDSVTYMVADEIGKRGDHKGTLDKRVIIGVR